MKIALLTIWREKNFGAELQAYATIKVLQMLGYDVRMIDVRLSDCPRLNWKGRIANFISRFGPAHRKFCKFWKENIPTTKRYKSVKSLQNNPPNADVYLVGSDQVWNPEVTVDFALLYFLNFGASNIKRISYASSFGTDKWKFPELKNEVKGLLDSFSHITCRESSGVKILKDEFELDAEQVLDPTLLIEDYKALTGDIQEQNLLVYYPLEYDLELELFSNELACELGMEVKNGNSSRKLLGRIEWDRPDISEWIRNIAEAKFVITRSFHGMVFAIMHKRQFAVVADKYGRGTRLVSLLKLLGLDDRYFDSLEKLKIAEPWKKIIDYSIVTPKLIKLRERSINILRQNIDT